MLLSVTDNGGLSAYAARAVQVDVPSAQVTPLDLEAILDRVASHALASGRFASVSTHEPKAAPAATPGAPTAAVWVDSVEPARASSGLATTTIRLGLNVRVYASMLSEPQDAIDPAVVKAVDALLAAYSGDFTLGGVVRAVDLLGSVGTPLSARAGYLTQDSKLYRVMTITVPLIVNDVWEQVA